jgi:hypothetical protein
VAAATHSSITAARASSPAAQPPPAASHAAITGATAARRSAADCTTIPTAVGTCSSKCGWTAMSAAACAAAAPMVTVAGRPAAHSAAMSAPCVIARSHAAPSTWDAHPRSSSPAGVPAASHPGAACRTSSHSVWLSALGRLPAVALRSRRTSVSAPGLYAAPASLLRAPAAAAVAAHPVSDSDASASASAGGRGAAVSSAATNASKSRSGGHGASARSGAVSAARRERSDGVSGTAAPASVRRRTRRRVALPSLLPLPALPLVARLFPAAARFMPRVRRPILRGRAKKRRRHARRRRRSQQALKQGWGQNRCFVVSSAAAHEPTPVGLGAALLAGATPPPVRKRAGAGTLTRGSRGRRTTASRSRHSRPGSPPHSTCTTR